jgi:acyl-CoA thioesterase-1
MLSRLLFLLTLAVAPAVAPSAAYAGTILVFGDSLSAAYGLAQTQGWVSLLEKRLRDEGFNYRVANASISGETTTGGAGRIEGALKAHRPDIVVLELGANDGLRGQGLDVMKRNLETMIDASRAAKADVLLVGMRLPPNYGTAYTEKFRQAYADLARSKKIALVPFLFEGLSDDARFFQADRVHPTSEGQTVMLETIWKGLQPLLRRKKGGV